MDATCAPPPARPNCDCGAYYRDATRRDGTTTRDDATTTRFAIEGRGRAVEGGISTAGERRRAGRARDAGAKRPRDRGAGRLTDAVIARENSGVRAEGAERWGLRRLAQGADEPVSAVQAGEGGVGRHAKTADGAGAERARKVESDGL